MNGLYTLAVAVIRGLFLAIPTVLTRTVQLVHELQSILPIKLMDMGSKLAGHTRDYTRLQEGLYVQCEGPVKKANIDSGSYDNNRILTWGLGVSKAR